jgi:hypothetical protein
MCGTKCAREQDACLSLLARTVQGMGQESYTLVEESIERTPVVAHNRAWYPAKMSGHLMSLTAFRFMSEDAQNESRASRLGNARG